MKKYLPMLIFLFAVISLANAQKVTRLKSWNFLDQPPVPVKTFNTTKGAFMVYSKLTGAPELAKLETDGSLTKLLTLQGRTTTDADDFVVKTDGETAVFSQVYDSDVYFFSTKGTAESTKLIYQYRKSYVNPPDFALLKGSVYILTAELTAINLSDFTSKVLAKIDNYQDYFKVQTDGEKLFITNRNGNDLILSEVETATGALNPITSKLNIWNTTLPLISHDKHLIYWATKDTTVSMNGSNFVTKRTVLVRYNSTSRTSDTVLYAGYFQAVPPDYLGAIGNKLYFLGSGDFDLKNCNQVTCSGNKGTYLIEVSGKTHRTVKALTDVSQYEGIKQIASDKIYLEIKTEAAGKELWVATQTDLYMVKDFNPRATSLKDYMLHLDQAATCEGKIALPGMGLFGTSEYENELWISDGSKENLSRVDVIPKQGVASNPKGLVNLNGLIYFIASDTLVDDKYKLPMTSVFTIDICNVGGSNTTSISNLNVENGMVIYPNHATSSIHLKTNQQLQTVEIYTPSGKRVLKSNNFHNGINISQLKNGLYILKAKSGNKQYVGRFIKIEN